MGMSPKESKSKKILENGLNVESALAALRCYIRRGRAAHWLEGFEYNLHSDTGLSLSNADSGVAPGKPGSTKNIF